MAFDWSCTSCTYRHKAPGNRCVMCGNLRNASALEMRAFIEGSTVRKKVSLQPDDVCESGDRLPLSNPYVRKDCNPYAKSLKRTAPMTPLDEYQRILEDENQPNRPFQPSEQQESLVISKPDSQQTARMPLISVQNNLTQSACRPISSHGDPSSSAKHTNSIVRASHQVYQAGPVPLNAETAKDWIYPVHPDYPVRDYQLEIAQTAIHYNTLVSLPTGLGKTLIAAVVLYNFYRWFPIGGKVVFLAPTLPLVDQQVKACYQVMGIPAPDTAVLNGKVPASIRESLWLERRVFFCTPQTVEKDIEAGRCPASQVVCLVLDEAHKAMGNFAYTKVVDLCEAAGAHFRILGLSATPGAKVQQVQKVIDALRITRLEARSEDEVKDYIHVRHNEIVVVKKRTICHDIEQRFNALISPIMSKLRANTNISRKIGSSDHTLTSFCIHRARQHHHETTSDHRWDGYFFAAQKLIDARSNLFSHGIGSVRTKLLELRNTPQRGVLGTVAKSPEFEAIVEAVLSASSGKQSQETAEDKKGNNPKLEKLDEILREHFLRADASGYTTRAIVFSQWRDSVSEIVDVLSLSQPLIRPRHFVGQSSGSTNKVGVMKGMPQKVQQQVIADFQQGTFNVLVCTCIGEEGLDIGEVDLIVNYDTLRSPIRMIQRVGRTGRKRDGRVVCLVSEGQEEKDMIRSKNNEKSLQRALRRSDNFKLRPNCPMFPEEPKLFKRTMVVGETLRLSQVGGHAEPDRVKKAVTADANESWKLTAQEESIRFQTFGPINSVASSTTSFPACLKRKLLRARTKAYSLSRAAAKGAKMFILQSIESRLEQKEQLALLKTSRFNDRDNAGLFPLEDAKCSGANTIIKSGWDERVPLPTVAHIHVGLPVPFSSTDRTLPEELPERKQPLSSRSNADCDQSCTTPVKASLSVETNMPNEVGFPKKNPDNHTGKRSHSPPALSLRLELPTPPGSSSEGDDNDETGCESYYNASMIEMNLPSANSSSDSDVGCSSEERIMSMRPCEENEFVRGGRDHVKGDSVKTGNDLRVAMNIPNAPIKDFFLPTQESSSEGSQYANDEDAVSLVSANTKVGSAILDTISEVKVCKHHNVGTSDGLTERELPRMRTGNLRSCVGQTFESNPAFPCEIVANNDLINPHNGATVVVKDVYFSNGTHNEETQKPLNADESQFEVLEGSPELVIRRRRSVSGRNLILSQDGDFTLQCGGVTPMACQVKHLQSRDLKVSDQRFSDCLVDTPPRNTTSPKEMQQHDISEIVCAVCLCGDSNDSDPIVLCDGFQGKQCDIAVHTSCYTLDKTLVSRLEEWLCDVCHYKSSADPSAIDPTCSVCQLPGGALKSSSKSPSPSWIHQYCMSWNDKDVATACDYCSFPGASACASARCCRAAHPHCVRFVDDEKSWLTVVDTLNGSRIMFCVEHKHESHSRYRFRPIEEETRIPKCLVLPSCRVEKLNAKVDVRRDQSAFYSRRRGKQLPDERELVDRDSSKVCHKRGPSPEKIDRRQRVRQNLMRRHQGMLKSIFISNEADIDTDEDFEGDDEEASDIRRIDEEEELAALDFINDSSQLGTYTQDALDRVDHIDCVDPISVHRQVDIENEIKRQFTTPILNRRMTRKRANSLGSDAWDESQNSSASRSSLKGLGNCYFIRSVIDHARNGGDADDIEAIYNEVEQMVAAEEEEETRGAEAGVVQPIQPFVVEYLPSDEDES